MPLIQELPMLDRIDDEHKWTVNDGMLILVTILVTVAFVLGYFSGMYRVNDSLPDCQEDEYLYPVDYTGAGNNVASDYRCVHVDLIGGK